MSTKKQTVVVRPLSATQLVILRELVESDTPMRRSSLNGGKGDTANIGASRVSRDTGKPIHEFWDRVARQNIAATKPEDRHPRDSRWATVSLLGLAYVKVARVGGVDYISLTDEGAKVASEIKAS